MSRRHGIDPLTPEQLARIKRQVAGAHALGGPTYADCKEILRVKVVKGPRPGYFKWRKPTAQPLPAPEIEERRKERAAWWQARGA